MELRVLRYFLAAAHEENITRAAQVLHMTQPSLSRQLMQLEEELGVRLFSRGKRRLCLTKDGMLLRQRAEEIIELADKTEREFSEQQEICTGTISIGCTEAMAASFLPDLIKGFALRFPEIRYEFFCGNSDDVRERMDKGITDIGMIQMPIDEEKYNFVQLPNADRWGILLPCSDPLAGEPEISLRQISSKPLLLPVRPSLRNEIVGWFKAAGSDIHVLATYNTVAAAIVLTQNGVGFVVCPETAFHLANSRLFCFRPLTPEKVIKGVVIWKKNQIFSTATDKLIQFTNDAYKA